MTVPWLTDFSLTKLARTLFATCCALFELSRSRLQMRSKIISALGRSKSVPITTLWKG